MIRLFCGYDKREAVGFHVFVHSVLEHASRPVAITPIGASGMAQGTNGFTHSRFLVPWLCGYQGHAIFMDASDMLMLDDVAELDALFDPSCAVQCVQHLDYTTRHPRKYVGTPMEAENQNYPRKNWASVMVINCAHPDWRGVNPRTLALVGKGVGLLRLTEFVTGILPNEWNRLVDEGQPVAGAKVLHWTAGIPAFDRYRHAPGADQWFAAKARMLA